jgi:RND family efflux transporter MFP subunit
MRNLFSREATRWPFHFVTLGTITAILGLGIRELHSAPIANEKEGGRPGAIEAAGRTQCAPRRRAIIAPAAPPHPVIDVQVAVGDRVKRGQVLIRIDDDEAQADLRAKEATLEGSIAVRDEARCRLEAVEKLHEKGAIPEEHYHDVRTAAAKAEKDASAAKAAVEGAKAELEHFTVTAGIDGVVNQLDVHIGTVSRPGTTVWGEILDLSEIDVRCDLNPDQIEQLAVGASAEVRTERGQKLLGNGKLVFIGLAADRNTGLVPVLVRLTNPEGRLRCQIPVQVRFMGNSQP